MTGTYAPIPRNEVPSGTKWGATWYSLRLAEEIEYSIRNDGSVSALYMRTRNQTGSPAWNYYAWKAADGGYVVDL